MSEVTGSSVLRSMSATSHLAADGADKCNSGKRRGSTGWNSRGRGLGKRRMEEVSAVS